jgi:hypothetical protein
MTETNELALNVPAGKYGVSDFLDVSKGGDWLPRLNVMTGNSTLVQEGKMNVGRYALIINKDTFKDLGPEVEGLAIAFRPRAMRTTVEPPQSFYDPKSPEFEKVREESAIKDSGSVYGPEFLIWLPNEEMFCTMLFGSISSRREAPQLFALMKGDDDVIRPAKATFATRFIETKKYKWHAPRILPYTGPMTNPPEQEELLKVIEKFNSPVDTQVERVEPAQGGRER